MRKTTPGRYLRSYPAAELIGSSKGCRNQGVVIGERLIALQFHPEMTGIGVEALVENCRGELSSTEWVQTEKQLLSGRAHLQAVNQVMESLLDHCARGVAAV